MTLAVLLRRPASNTTSSRRSHGISFFLVHDPFLTDSQLELLGKILEIDEPRLQTLRAPVEQRLREYVYVVRNSPQESRPLGRTIAAVQAILRNALHELSHITDAQRRNILLLEYERPELGRIPSDAWSEQLQAIIESVGFLETNMPPTNSGRPKLHLRRALVEDLYCEYIKARPRILINGTMSFDRPRRSYDPIHQRDTGRFLDFVKACLESVVSCVEEIPGPETHSVHMRTADLGLIHGVARGVADVVRSVCRDMGRT